MITNNNLDILCRQYEKQIEIKYRENHGRMSGWIERSKTCRIKSDAIIQEIDGIIQNKSIITEEAVALAELFKDYQNSLHLPENKYFNSLHEKIKLEINESLSDSLYLFLCQLKHLPNTSISDKWNSVLLFLKSQCLKSRLIYQRNINWINESHVDGFIKIKPCIIEIPFETEYEVY